MVGVPRFELGASSSRTKRSARLSYTPGDPMVAEGVKPGEPPPEALGLVTPPRAPAITVTLLSSAAAALEQPRWR